jgi:hypothetical protein
MGVFSDGVVERPHKSTLAWMPALNTTLDSNLLRREQLLRKAALLIFCDPLPEQCRRLENLSHKLWQKVLNTKLR